MVSFLGGSLSEYGKIEEKILCYVAVAVVKGLQYLWSMKFMHRGFFFFCKTKVLR